MPKPKKDQYSDAEVRDLLENVVGIEEAASILGITSRRVRALAKGNRLPHKLLGKEYAFWRPQLFIYKDQPRPTGRPRKKPVETSP